MIAIDLPFFMSEADAIGRAKQKIPARFYDQTWILAESDFEKALDIPVDSHKAFVMALNARGEIIARVEGEPTEARISLPLGHESFAVPCPLALIGPAFTRFVFLGSRVHKKKTGSQRRRSGNDSVAWIVVAREACRGTGTPAAVGPPP